MRVRFDQAVLYYRLLYEERKRLSLERSRWRSNPDAMPGFNRALALIDASRHELERLADEKGWELRGQSGYEDSEGADPIRAARPRRGLG
jgi:hypothetical protein